MRLFNTSRRALTFPNGETVEAGSPDPVEVTAADAKHPVVQAWLKDGAVSKDSPKTSAPSKGDATKTVEVKVADLDDDAVKAAITAAETASLAGARDAWEAFKTLPDTATPEQSQAAVDAVDAALGLSS